MDNRDFSNLGNQIRESVQDAIDSMDFEQLNHTISDTVNDALDEAKCQLKKEPGYKAFQTSRTKNPKWSWNQKGRLTGILYTVFGGIGLGIVGILFLTVFILSIVVKPFWGALLGSVVFLLVLASIFAAMLGNGISIGGRLRRAQVYAKQAGDKLYCSVSELAKILGKSPKFVIKDIQKLIEKGVLPEAHLDEQKTCLMLNDSVYEQYLLTQDALKQRQKTELQEKNDASKKREVPEELAQMMDAGQKYLQTLREANDAITGAVISDKISRLEMIIRRIFDSVEKHPEHVGEMERFMEYYLPTTVKLVNAYRDFDSVEIEGANIISAKHEIEETLDTINRAFERLLDDLYQNAALDVSTDASVLQTMLKKDGWAESDFNRREE